MLRLRIAVGNTYSPLLALPIEVLTGAVATAIIVSRWSKLNIRYLIAVSVSLSIDAPNLFL
jgi:hypothetical protein